MDLQRAIDLIEKSEHVALLLPETPSLDTVAAAEVVSRVIDNTEKTIGVIIPDSKEAIPRPDVFKKIAGAQPLTKEFIISLDTSDASVSQLRYENKDDHIDVIFSPKNAPIRESAVSFREGKTLCSVIISFGVTDIDTINVETGLEPSFFTETPIINIDTSADNKQYGEVNLIDEEKSSLSEIVYELASSLKNGPLDEDCATFILAGIVSRTKQFTDPETSAATFLNASELMRLGARLKDASSIASSPKSLNLQQLIGRSSVRTKTGGNGVLWSFVTADDFEKTNRSPDDIPEILNHLEKNFTSQRVHTLLWQNPAQKTIHATLAGDASLLEALAGSGVGQFQSPNLLIVNSFQSFREAEEKISELIEGVL